MALKAWYTFNNNYNNQGCGDAELTVATAPTYVDGKLGKALNQGGFKWTAAQTASILNNKTVSICFWVYIDLDEGSTSNRAMFFGNDTMNTLGGRQFSLFNYPTSNDLHYSWQNCINGTYTSICGGIYSGCIPARTWTHVAVTYNNPTGTIYINGERKTTFTCNSNTDSFAFDTQVIHNSAYHKFNDFRIYDECLSDKQIKEISKGLVCHYKLEGIAANENLILRSDKITGGSQASGITRTYMSDGSTKFVAVSGNGNYASISFAEDSKTNVGNKLSAGDTYTMSCDILVEEGTKYPDIFINNTNGYKTLEGPTLKTGVWQRVYYTKTWNDPGTSTYGNISLHIGFSSAIGTYYFKNFKLEKGSLTQWTPAPTDPMYKALGYNNILTSDCSGNGYIGVITGSLTHNFNTPRYSGSTSFDGNSYITTAQGSMAWFPFDKCTLSCWLYPTTAPSSWAGSVGVQHNGGAGSKMFSISNYAGKFSVQLDSGTAYVTVQSETLPLNTWTYCAATIEGTTLKMYMNGQLVKTYTLDWGSAAVRSETNFSIGVDLPGGDETFVGSISDVRLYTTVLSAEDILTMYKTSGIIDNKGNIYSYEFKEE